LASFCNKDSSYQRITTIGRRSFSRSGQDAAQQIIQTTGRTYRTNATLTLQDFTSPAPRWREAQDLRILILGGCLTQIAADELDRVGPRSGLSHQRDDQLVRLSSTRWAPPERPSGIPTTVVNGVGNAR
jgi:hypothetical protein